MIMDHQRHNIKEQNMELGNFSVSLAVKDIDASKLFYEKLGSTVFGGDQSQNWLIMKNADGVVQVAHLGSW